MNQEFLEKIGIEVSNVNGNEIQFKCPFHDDTNPSASFNTTDLVYNCFVCGGGSLKYLTKQLGYEDISIQLEKIPPSIISLEKQLSDMMQTKSIDEDIFEDEFNMIENEMECPDYLLNRVKYETVLNFDLHICDSYKSFYNERIIFPLYSYNNRGFVARDYTEMKPQKYLFPKNMKKQEYLFGDMRNDTVIVVEGVFDVMKLWEYGYYSCVSTMGITIGDIQVEMMIKNGIKNIILMPDGDDAGRNSINNFDGYTEVFQIDAMFSVSGKDPCDMSKYEVDMAYEKRWDVNQLFYNRKKEDSLLDKLLSTLMV